MLTRRLKDRVARKLMFGATLFSSLIVVVIVISLTQKSLPILSTQPLTELLFSSVWHPSTSEFGLFPFLMGGLWVTGLAMVISIPSSILVSIYMAEYAPKKIRSFLKPVIDLLAGIPSVIYGLWGLLFIVPLIRDFVGPMIGVTTTGYTVLAGGVVLSIMVFPITISVSEEVMRTIPKEAREASLALGATKWQTVKHVVLRSAFPGIFAAIILGFGRAFGETMAVLMVVGNVAKVPGSVFDPAYPIPALIANNYGEMMSIPLYDSALMLAALILLVFVMIFSITAEIILNRMKRKLALG